MKRATLSTLVVLLAAAAWTAPASAASRPVTLSGGNLQALLSSVDPGITVTTDQVDIQKWTCNASNNIQLTLMFEAGGAVVDNTVNNTLGIFNDGEFNNPFVIFPASAEPGWSAAVTFETDDDLVVSLFDDAQASQGQTTTPNVNKDSFVYFVKNGTTFGYGRDFLQGDEARVIVFAGTGVNTGGWFLCFEDGVPDGPAEAQDFDDAVVFVHAVNPSTPAVRSTWGALKSRFR